MSLGEALTIARRARGLTQAELAERVGITQAALSRYEHALRIPTDPVLAEIAETLGVTPNFLKRADRVEGALAITAHMRRRATAKATIWHRLESQLMLYRLHVQHVFDEIELQTSLTIPWLDPFDYDPATAARIVRMQWRMPSGPVRDLTGWMERAGCTIFGSDFGTPSVDALSLWSGPHPVVMVNTAAPVDRMRFTLAHELGHLCMHSQGVPDEVEDDANAFAAEFLMPEEMIRPQLHNLTTGRLHDLKRLWGVSMRALIERGYHLRTVTAQDRRYLYKRIGALGWRTREPVSDELALEEPHLVGQIGRALMEHHSPSEIAAMLGFADSNPSNPFVDTEPRLRLVLPASELGDT